MTLGSDSGRDGRPPAPIRARLRLLGRMRHHVLPMAALLALLAAIAAGAREYATARALLEARLNSQVEAATAKLRDHLVARETLARSVGAAFLPPPGGINAAALRDVDPRLLTYVPDVLSFVWVPRVDAGQIDDLYAALAATGVEKPAILGPDRTPLAAEEIEPPLFVILNILPATAQNRMSLGLNLGALPLPREALVRAEAQRDIAATGPLELVQLPGVKALVLYVPVFDRAGPRSQALGYLGFSFRFDTLVGSAIEGVALPGPMRVIDASETPAEVFATSDWPPPDAVLARDLQFGGRTWRVEFAAPALNAPAMARGVVVGGLLLIAFGAILLIVRHLRRTGARLEEALAAQLLAEERLQVLIKELTHRIKNVYAVAASVASQTFGEIDRDGSARNAFVGRLQSLAGATALVTEGGAERASLRALVAALGLPFAERVALRGHDLDISAQAAQSLALVIHELWTNAAKHGALAGPDGRVELDWRIRDDGFELEWKEQTDPPPPALPARQGFGRRLLERMVPGQLGGTGRLTLGSSGVRYALVVPKDNVLATSEEHATA